VLRTPTATTNFDRAVVSCYDLGEYQTLARSSGDDGESVTAAWGDNRNSWTCNVAGCVGGAAPSPVPGPHSQPDVFSTTLHGDD
jgi:hypothetical protein